MDEFRVRVLHPMLVAMAYQIDRAWLEDHPDVKPWFHEDAEPGPYTDDPEDGYPYDE